MPAQQWIGSWFEILGLYFKYYLYSSYSQSLPYITISKILIVPRIVNASQSPVQFSCWSLFKMRGGEHVLAYDA
jgi:hypothetical protein